MKYLLLLITLLCFTSCEKKEDTQQMLKINIQGDPPSLHPQLGIDLNCRCLQKALFEGLTRINNKNTYEPAAAEKIEISEDKLRYTFTLRPLKWSNGEEVTAHHFANSWKRGIAQDSNCLRADLFYVIKNAKLAKKGEISLDDVGIYVKDNKTLVVELEHPAPYFLDLTANPLYAPLYDDNEKPSIFNGPFVVDQWIHDRTLILKQNVSYWDSKNVRLKGIEVMMVKDPHTALLMYEKGEIDWIGSPFTLLPLDSIPNFEKNGQIRSKNIAGVYWFCCNTKTLSLSSAKIRKALSYVINRKEIAFHVLHGETPTVTIASPHLLDIKEDEIYLDGNIEMAKTLFKEGLEEIGLTPETFPPIQFSHSDISGQKSLVETIALEWEKTLGIKVELYSSEWNVFFSNLGTRQFEIGGCIFYFLYNDPIYPMEFFKDLANRYNAPQWENAEYHNLIISADKETDLVKRREFLKKAQMILMDEMPIIPLYVVNCKYMVKDNIKGIFISDLGHVDFKWVSKEI